MYRRHRFETRYQLADVELLAAVDMAHEVLRGLTTQKILQREFYDRGDRRYQRLAPISVAHLYRLRQRKAYRRQRMGYEEPAPRRWALANGERRNRKGGPDTCRWTRYTKVIWTGRRGYSTSMP